MAPSHGGHLSGRAARGSVVPRKMPCRPAGGSHCWRFKARATLLKGWRLLRQWRTAVIRAARSTGLSPFSVRKRRPPDVPAHTSRAPSSPTCRLLRIDQNSSSSSTCKRRGHSASTVPPKALTMSKAMDDVLGRIKLHIAKGQDADRIRRAVSKAIDRATRSTPISVGLHPKSGRL